MFEAQLTQASLLKKLLDSIKDLIENANFDFTTDGMSLQVSSWKYAPYTFNRFLLILIIFTQELDATHAVLITLILRTASFETYRCDKPLSMVVNLGSLATIMKVAGADDSVKISTNDDCLDVVDIEFDSQVSSGTANFQLKLLNIDSERMGIPEDTEYAAVICMPSTEYRRIFTDLLLIGDTISIEAMQTSVTFSVKGDVSNGSVTINQGGGEDMGDTRGISLEVGEPITFTGSGKFLALFAKAAPIADTVTICMEPDNPIAVEFSIPGQLGSIRYFLAPQTTIDE